MKILAVFSVVLLCVLVDSQLLGKDKCTWGPSYWCSHIKHAKECAAVDHCVSTVWKNQKITVKDSPSCTFCQLMVNNVRHSLKFSTRKTESYNLVAKTCTVLPESLRHKCKDLVKNDLEEVIQLLSSDVDQKTVCAAMQLCEKSEDKVEHLVVAEKYTPPANSDCSDCKAFFGDVQKKLTDNQTIAQLENMVDSLVCAQLGPLEDLCKKMVHNYVILVAKFLHDQFDPDTLCHLISFCQNGGSLSDTHTPAWLLNTIRDMYKVKYGGTECELCETAVTDVRNMIREKTVQDTIKNYLENNVCSLLGTLESQCKQYVEAYAPLVFEVLVNELDPKAVCTAIGFCANNATPKVKLHRVSLKSTLTHVNAIPQIPEPVKEKVSSGPECILCEFVMKEIDEMIGSNRSEVAVEKALDEVCDILPTTITQECKDFIASYGKAIIQLLVQELDPLKICTTIGLCKKSAVSIPVVPVHSNDAVCDICTDMVSYFLNYLKQKATIDQVKALLEDICNRLPDAISKQCDAFVDQYIQLVLDLIAQEYSAKQICQAISLCPQKSNKTLYFLKTLRRGGVY